MIGPVWVSRSTADHSSVLFHKKKNFMIEQFVHLLHISQENQKSVSFSSRSGFSNMNFTCSCPIGCGCDDVLCGGLLTDIGLLKRVGVNL